MIRQCLRDAPHFGPHEYGPPVSAPSTEHGRCLATVRVPLIHADPAPEPNLTQQERDAAAHPGLPAAALEKPMSAELGSQAPGVSGPVASAASPTGKPLVSPKAVPYLMLVVAIAAAIAAGKPDLFPSTTIDQTIASLIVSLGALLGLASPGLRK